MAAPGGHQYAEAYGQTQQDEPELILYGKLSSKIVGIQYYRGIVSLGEMVHIVREPTNPYDRWALRVDNVEHTQVGHIPRVVAQFVSPLVDAGKLVVEGTVRAKSGQNKYTLPADLYMHGTQADQAYVCDQLRRGGLYLQAVHPAPVPDMSMPRDLYTTTRMTPSQMKSALDGMFEDIQEDQLRVQCEPSATVLSKLYPHQKEALAWMIGRENKSTLPPFWEPKKMAGTLYYNHAITNYLTTSRPATCRGGILADDMGLGKTLEVISLIASNRPGIPPPEYMAEDVAPKPKKRKGKAAEAADEAAIAAPVLIPLAERLAKMKKKKKNAAEEAALAQEPPEAGPAAGGPRPTLIVCPTSVIGNWQSQIEEHTDGSLSVLTWHGDGRSADLATLAAADVIITTYGTLGHEYTEATGTGKKKGKKKKANLMDVEFLRVVLDEGHVIKNPKANQSKAATALKSSFRWIVSGTPIQNSLKDLHSLLSFLDLDQLKDKSIFTRTIERPIKDGDVRGLKTLKVLMGNMAMRRTKDLVVNGRPIVQLPEKTVMLQKVKMTGEDREKYDKLEHAGRAFITHLVEAETLMSNWTNVLELILRLRQMCDSPALIPEGYIPADPAKELARGATLDNATKTRLLAVLAAGGGEECSICLGELQIPVITPCAHVYCKQCILTVLEQVNQSCPLCRHQLRAADLLEAPENEQDDSQEAGLENPSPSQQSAKVAVLMGRLLANEKDRMPDGGRVKSVVFSQFAGMLALVARALKDNGISFVQLDGSVASKKRVEMIRAFARKAEDGPTVFLISLKAGGVGLNLTAACQVHCLDPWWNPAVEEQAMDRVHRLGQTAPVSVYRYVIEDSIEERMLKLQDRKRELMATAFERKSADAARLQRFEDVRLLMELR